MTQLSSQGICYRILELHVSDMSETLVCMLSLSSSAQFKKRNILVAAKVKIRSIINSQALFVCCFWSADWIFSSASPETPHILIFFLFFSFPLFFFFFWGGYLFFLFHFLSELDSTWQWFLWDHCTRKEFSCSWAATFNNRSHTWSI